jgi:hypothetical protein
MLSAVWHVVSEPIVTDDEDDVGTYNYDGKWLRFDDDSGYFEEGDVPEWLLNAPRNVGFNDFEVEVVKR